MAQWVHAERKWLKTFLYLPHGIPSHDTFGRVFAALSPEVFEWCFSMWMQALAQVRPGELIALDGKSLRHSFDRASDEAAIHMISAWSSANGLVFGQLATEAKSNEITRSRATKARCMTRSNGGLTIRLPGRCGRPLLDFHEAVTKDHGRLEIRRVWCTEQVRWFADRKR